VTGTKITKNVPDHALMAGNPARQMGWICQCGIKLNEKYQCSQCSNKYKLKAKKGLQRIK
jgi:UDP-2-acetamido-3-amino-2,3-dideoxy-glucuronate N-acetyltransferase